MEPSRLPSALERLRDTQLSIEATKQLPSRTARHTAVEHLRGFVAFSWFMITRFVYLVAMGAGLVVGAIGGIITLVMSVAWLVGADHVDFSGTPVTLFALFVGLAMLYYACMRNPVTLRKLLEFFRL